MTFSLTMSSSDLLLLLPEIILTCWLCLVLIVDFSFPRLPKEQLAYLSIAGLVATLGCLAWFDFSARREAGFYIPAVTSHTDKRCVSVGGAERCKVAIQSNNLDVDDRADALNDGPGGYGAHACFLKSRYSNPLARAMPFTTLPRRRPQSLKSLS